MKYLAYLTFLTTFLFSSTIEVLQWADGLAFTKFLENEQLPQSLYKKADDDDKKAIEDIQARSRYYVLRNKYDELEQALIPLSEELQAHIYKSNGKYHLENIPIEFQELDKQFVVKIVGTSVFNDINKMTNSPDLAGFFVKTLKDRIDFKRDIHKGSIVAMLFKRKYRLGYPFGGINLKIAMLETGNKKKYVINYNSKNYNAYGEYVEKYSFIRPVKKGTYRISSPFTKKRFHPILKKYRAHLGTDYAARRGTPIFCSGDGKVVFASRTRGYGNLVKIKHRGGYLTLYAHMKKFKKGLKVGDKLKGGDLVGYVGTTGLSTGPHLHFGLYKDGLAINPESLVSIQVKNSIGKKNEIPFQEFRDKNRKKLTNIISDFKNGLSVFEKYKYEKLFSEVSFSNTVEVESASDFLESDLNKDIMQDEKFREENINLLKEESESPYYPANLYYDDEEFELSEDYQLY